MKNIKKKGRKGYKIAAMGCVLILAVSAAVTVWADTQFAYKTITSLKDGENTSSQDVVGRYTPGKNSDNGTVVAYDIIWGDMKFSYEESGKGTWNAATHEYDYKFDTKGWSPESPDGNKITVLNRSNTDIKVEARFIPTSGHWDIKPQFTGDGQGEYSADMTLESAEKTHQVVKGSWYLQIVDGVMSKDDKIGTITISEGRLY